MRSNVVQRRNSYEACLTHGGNRIRRSFKTPEEAHLWCMDAELKFVVAPDTRLKDFVSASYVNNSTIRDAFDVTKENHWEGNKDSKKTYQNAEQACSYFGDDMVLHTLTKADIDGYILYLKNDLWNSDATVNRKLSALSMMLKEAVDYGWIDTYPKIVRKKSEASRLSFFTTKDRQDIQFTMSQDSPECAMLFIFLCDTGLRITEALSLEWEDIKEVDGVKCVHVREGKKNESMPRFVPLTTNAQAVLKEITKVGGYITYKDVGPFQNLSYAKCRRVWERVRHTLRREEEKDFVWHTCRHTFCSRLVQRGVDLAQVAKLAGHKNIATTMRYVHLDTKSSLTAIGKLDG